jgi:MOSC domain-containing protein YiiM
MTELMPLLQAFPRHGRVEAIVLRPGRGEAAVQVPHAEAVAGLGLQGDRITARPRSAAGDGGKRQVTLIQAEHLPLIAAWGGVAAVRPEQLRRNLVVSGINLLAARSPLPALHLRLHVGGAVVLLISGPCDPCSRMESAIGPGGYNAMRGHGGMTARIEAGGPIRIGDAVWVEAVSPLP